MQPCKKTTETTVKFFADKIRQIPIPVNITTWILAYIHYIIIIGVAILLLTKDVNTYYYLYLTIGLLVIASNYYFHGCILTKIERELFQDKNWFGLITQLKYIHVPISKEQVNFYIKYAVTFIVIGVLIKSFYQNEYILFAFLAILLTPLLFVKSQSLSELDPAFTSLS